MDSLENLLRDEQELPSLYLIGGSMTQTATTILDGYYTVVFDTEHRTFHIWTQPADATFAPGKRLIALLGKGGEYTTFAFVERNGGINVWRRFISCYAVVAEAARFLTSGDTRAAGTMYAMQSGRCWRCNRMLTDPLSIKLGIGPYCREQL